MACDYYQLSANLSLATIAIAVAATLASCLVIKNDEDAHREFERRQELRRQLIERPIASNNYESIKHKTFTPMREYTLPSYERL